MKHQGEGSVHKCMKRAICDKAQREQWLYRQEWNHCDLVLLDPKELRVLAVEIETTPGNSLRNWRRNTAADLQLQVIVTHQEQTRDGIRRLFRDAAERTPPIFLLDEFLAAPLDRHFNNHE